jgi:hypothetical protein
MIRPALWSEAAAPAAQADARYEARLGAPAAAGSLCCVLDRRLMAELREAHLAATRPIAAAARSSAEREAWSVHRVSAMSADPETD